MSHLSDEEEYSGSYNSLYGYEIYYPFLHIRGNTNSKTPASSTKLRVALP